MLFVCYACSSRQTSKWRIFVFFARRKFVFGLKFFILYVFESRKDPDPEPSYHAVLLRPDPDYFNSVLQH